ncbi:RHS repeat domain-containing protein [Apibacter adventoris]|nr:RHS repeat-associated core domain-containing protein [Apibacter adventoris]
MPYHGKDHNDYVNGAGFCCEGKDKKHQAYGGGIGKGNEEYEKKQYYDHADHLGSSSYITNLDAQIVQHVEYVPFGEVFIEKRNQSWNIPYLFNGKELDEETGLYYYGARYYNPRESVFLSVDPMLEQTGTPYQYTYQNPINYTDPTGMKGESVDDWIKNKHGKYLDDKNATSQETTRAGWTYVGKELPKNVDSKGQDILEEDRSGRLVHKNTDNWIGRLSNKYLNTNFPEKKVYDQVEENFTNELVTTSAGSLAGGVILKVGGKVVGGVIGNTSKVGMTTVGRWMSKAEYEIMVKTGKMVEGAGGQTFVATGGQNAFTSAAKGSVYAEFQVPTNSLLQGGKEGWFKVIGPNAGKAMQGALQKQGGQLLPKVKNLTPILKTK